MSPPIPVAVSVVVPVHNEEGACVQVAQEIVTAFSKVYGPDGFEVVFVDDSSSDHSLARLNAAMADMPQMRVLHHGKNVGKSGAIRTGVLAARGDIIVTLDGDGQNPADDAARMTQVLGAAPEDIGMVAGIRRNRQDKLSKKWASRWANGIRKALLNDGCDDTGCGLKAFRREVFLRLPYFDQMHRYMPSLIAREGYGVLSEPVDDRLRTTGQSKYTNIGRLAVALSDLPGVMWLNNRYRKPGKVTESGR